MNGAHAANVAQCEKRLCCQTTRFVTINHRFGRSSVILFQFFSLRVFHIVSSVSMIYWTQFLDGVGQMPLYHVCLMHTLSGSHEIPAINILFVNNMCIGRYRHRFGAFSDPNQRQKGLKNEREYLFMYGLINTHRRNASYYSIQNNQSSIYHIFRHLSVHECVCWPGRRRILTCQPLDETFSDPKARIDLICIW